MHTFHSNLEALTWQLRRNKSMQKRANICQDPAFKGAGSSLFGSEHGPVLGMCAMAVKIRAGVGAGCTYSDCNRDRDGLNSWASLVGHVYANSCNSEHDLEHSFLREGETQKARSRATLKTNLAQRKKRYHFSTVTLVQGVNIKICRRTRPFATH